MTTDAVSFVIPARNEADAIAWVVRECVRVGQARQGPFEVIVVDDDSRDDTAARVERLAAEAPNVRLLRHAQQCGIAQTTHDGLEAARHPVICYVDGDGQFDPSAFTLLLHHLDSADFVVGWRRSRAERGVRRLGSTVYNGCTRAIGVPVHDVNCGFRALRREAFDAVRRDVRARSSFYFAELTLAVLQRGYRVREVAVPHHPRRGGVASGAGMALVASQFLDLARYAVSAGRRHPDASRSPSSDG